jgi:hypothetical protein
MTFNCIVNVLDQLNLINEVKNIFINFKYFCCLAALKFYKWQTETFLEHFLSRERQEFLFDPWNWAALKKLSLKKCFRRVSSSTRTWLGGIEDQPFGRSSTSSLHQLTSLDSSLVDSVENRYRRKAKGQPRWEALTWMPCVLASFLECWYFLLSSREQPILKLSYHRVKTAKNSN